MDDAAKIRELAAFLQWLERGHGPRPGAVLCHPGYAGEMIEFGADFEQLAREFMASKKDVS